MKDGRSRTGSVGITVHFLTLFLWGLMGLALGGVGGIAPDFEKVFNDWQWGFYHFQGYWVGLGLLFAGLAIAFVGRQLGTRVLRG